MSDTAVAEEIKPSQENIASPPPEVSAIPKKSVRDRLNEIVGKIVGFASIPKTDAEVSAPAIIIPDVGKKEESPTIIIPDVGKKVELSEVSLPGAGTGGRADEVERLSKEANDRDVPATPPNDK